MSEDDNAELAAHKVLINDEEQYSLWPAHLKVPPGWKECKMGTKQECLTYVREVWTDMRPLSLRLKMQEDVRKDVRMANECTSESGAAQSNNNP